MVGDDESWEEGENGERKRTPHNQLPTPLQCDSTLQTGLEPLEPDSSSLFKALATRAREPRRNRRPTISPPVTFFCALGISISVCIVGLIDPLTSLSSFGSNRLRSCDILIPMVLGEPVLLLSWYGLLEDERKVRVISVAVSDDTWRSIKLGSMVIEEVVASLEMIVGTPVMYETSTHVPFVGLLILEVPSDSAVDFAKLGEGAITVGGDDCVGELELIVDSTHKPVIALDSPDLSVAAMLERQRPRDSLSAAVTVF
ncbi:hypothetical protein EV363DRAFT_1421600 [Boletus edulis]|nr:hypothetical protein EV363DRAFT_1421600 [Boletus edulis]